MSKKSVSFLAQFTGNYHLSIYFYLPFQEQSFEQDPIFPADVFDLVTTSSSPVPALTPVPTLAPVPTDKENEVVATINVSRDANSCLFTEEDVAKWLTAPEGKEKILSAVIEDVLTPEFDVNGFHLHSQELIPTAKKGRYEIHEGPLERKVLNTPPPHRDRDIEEVQQSQQTPEASKDTEDATE